MYYTPFTGKYVAQQGTLVVTVTSTHAGRGKSQYILYLYSFTGCNDGAVPEKHLVGH